MMNPHDEDEGSTIEARLDALDAAAVGLLEPLIAAMPFDVGGLPTTIAPDQATVAAAPAGADHEGPVTEGPVMEGPVMEGPVLEGPVMEGPVMRGSPRNWRLELAQALERLVRAAAALDLAGLVQTATLLADHLVEVAAHGSTPVACEPSDEILLGGSAALELALAEGWVSDAIAFCSGQPTDAAGTDDGPASDGSSNLVGRLRDWPGLGERLSAERASALSVRVRADAHRIAQATRASLRPVTAAATPASTAATSASTGTTPASTGTTPASTGTTPASTGTTPASSTEKPATPPALAVGLEIGADELRMLAEAARQLEEEFDEALASGVGSAAFLPIGDVIDRYARAMTHVGLLETSRAFSAWQENFDRFARQPERFSVIHRELLGALAAGWEAVFTDLSTAGAQQALAVLCDARWLQPLDAALAQRARQELAALSVIGTRRVTSLEAPTDDDAHSLAIPDAADPSVVDHLLRELPLLSAAFSLAIERAQEGSRDELAEAQRIAHTLKGAANTVGVRGIATLTHRLEGLLQLVEAGDAANGLACSSGNGIGLGDLLTRAADCLADMSDAVVEGTAAPAQIRHVHRSIDEWITRLSQDGARQRRDDAGAPGLAAGLGAPTGIAVGTGDGGGCAQAQEAESIPPRRPADAAAIGEEGNRVATDRDARAMPGVGGQDWLRVPASLIGRLLDVASEASILLAQSQEQAAEVDRVRSLLAGSTDQLQDLSSELERLVDVRGSMLGERRARDDFDPLELDEHSDLQMVARRIAEAGADGRLIEGQLGATVVTLRDLLSRLERLQVDVRETALQTRTTSVAAAVPRWMRTVRQSARMAQREAGLRVRGEDLAIDAPLLQELIAPIGHLLRNAVDHGIEDPLVREGLGKPRSGSIELHFLRDGRDLVIECSDDGAGLDFPAIRARALAMGLIDATAAVSDEALAHLILLPEFSTRDQVTQLSGRGIGLDVVGQTLRSLRGTVTLESRQQQGTRIVLRLPVHVSTLPVMIVRSPTHVLGLSAHAVEQIVDDRELDRSALARVVLLENVLGLPEDAFGQAENAGAPARVVFEVRMPDGSLVGVRAPPPGQPRNVVVRPLSALLAPVPGLEGAAVLGDGAAVPVYDLPRLLDLRADGQATPSLRGAQASLPLCLVIDDSVSVRRMMEQFVRDLGCEVASAGDGIEALDCIDRQIPAIVLVDLEMPRMNGIDFVRALRAREATRKVPVVMITSRSSDKHREAALRAGVDVFLTKPYAEDVLAAHIIERLQRPLATS